MEQMKPVKISRENRIVPPKDKGSEEQDGLLVQQKYACLRDKSCINFTSGVQLDTSAEPTIFAC
ncbi:hypothetical protein T12_11739 [Trichinella patagoniensis]|uniref:Uncharacterized protein n=1 Tax=Trichinella patagoniensis TaxID=990121 RepID=A0A0V0Z1J8_9BILA|nr:hypothetical protein T12_11739 [Trichinella patagoniensis]